VYHHYLQNHLIIMFAKLIQRIKYLLDFRSSRSLKIGQSVEFHNSGNIHSSNAYLGYLENSTVKIANKSPRSYLNNSGIIRLGDSVRIQKGFGIEVSGELSIGDKTYINPDCIIVCTNKITIGNSCAISWGVTLMDDDLHNSSTSDKSHTAITIEDNVWIGANAFITKGVTIGKGSIIGACSVVTKDVPPHCLFAGNPGKVVKENIHWK
jgi:acetyltransferase-like isoleucine patch superfamily enzyme